jgi:uncharacterized repeat protein (TIGR03803 family)
MSAKRQNAASIFDINLCRLPVVAFLVVVLATSVLLASQAQAQTYTILHNFTGGADGGNPEGRLTIDGGGHLYGTTYSGGIQYDGGFGVVFKMSPQGSGGVLSPMYTFNLESDGGDPAAGVLFGPDGVLYGTTSNGGTVFTLRPPPTFPPSFISPWTIDFLYDFPLFKDRPAGDVVFDSVGNIYGVTWEGGSDGCFDNQGCGTVYELTPIGAGGWQETTLYTFQGGTDGAYPAGVTFDSAGNLIGTASEGGAYGSGVIFQLTPSGGKWSESVLYNFNNQGNGGYSPEAGLISDASGNFYGSTNFTPSPTYSGTIFEFSPSNGGWTYTVLAQIPPQYELGPSAPLTMDAAGNLYGTIGNFSYGQLPGAVFKLTRGNNGWTFTSLHDFTGGNDGGSPASTVAFGANGNLYGTATYGGAYCHPVGCGVVWEITP